MGPRPSAAGLKGEAVGAKAGLLGRAAEAAALWRQATGYDDPHLAAALARSANAGGAIRDVLKKAAGAQFTPAERADRFEHFFAENEEILPAAGDALACRDMAAFGEWVDRSQSLCETLLGNQVPETVFLARTARELGATAASAFGAGFGGSVWALVDTDRAEDLVKVWSERYGEAFPVAAGRAMFFLTQAGPAAFDF